MLSGKSVGWSVVMNKHSVGPTVSQPSHTWITFFNSTSESSRPHHIRSVGSNYYCQLDLLHGQLIFTVIQVYLERYCQKLLLKGSQVEHWFFGSLGGELSAQTLI